MNNLTPEQEILLKKLQDKHPQFFKTFDLTVHSESPEQKLNRQINDRVDTIIEEISKTEFKPWVKPVERKPWDQVDLSKIKKGEAPF